MEMVMRNNKIHLNSVTGQRGKVDSVKEIMNVPSRQSLFNKINNNDKRKENFLLKQLISEEPTYRKRKS